METAVLAEAKVVPIINGGEVQEREPLASQELVQLVNGGLGWRSYLAIHPVASLFPRHGADDGADEQRMFEESVRKHGLRVPIVVWRKWEKQRYQQYIVDGIRRLDALEHLGQPIIENGELVVEVEMLSDEDDPYRECFIRNFLRRNLSAAQKRQLIFEFVKRHYLDAQRRGVQPWSDRRLAEVVGYDHHAIGYIRAELVSTGEISPVNKTEGKDRKARHTERPTRAAPTPKCSFCHQRFDVAHSLDGKAQICAACAFEALRFLKKHALAADTAVLLPLLTNLGLDINEARAMADPSLRLDRLASRLTDIFEVFGIEPRHTH
jgi:hypothetical protein